MMFEILRNIWIANGVLAGVFTLIVQLVGLLAVIVKLFEKK